MNKIKTAPTISFSPLNTRDLSFTCISILKEYIEIQTIVCGVNFIFLISDDQIAATFDYCKYCFSDIEF